MPAKNLIGEGAGRSRGFYYQMQGFENVTPDRSERSSDAGRL